MWSCKIRPFKQSPREESVSANRQVSKLHGSVGIDVAGDVRMLIEASKSMSSVVRGDKTAKEKRALFTIGLISKHFDFANVVDDTTRVRYSVCHSMIIIRVLYFTLGLLRPLVEVICIMSEATGQ